MSTVIVWQDLWLVVVGLPQVLLANQREQKMLTKSKKHEG